MNLFQLDTAYNMDCLDGMKLLPDKSIDLIFCDLPYGQTKNKWDVIIPPDKLWEQYNRIIKPNGAIVLFGKGKFSAQMIMSNIEMYRYSLVWEKTRATGFLNANKMPLQSHEDIMVFYKHLPTYNPQKTTGCPPVHKYTKRTSDGTNYGKTKENISGGGSTERYPTSVLRYPSDKQKESIHTTQKPVALCRYIIRMYSNEGDIVLDNCCGSGSIPKAAIIENRHFVAMDSGMCEKTKRPWADITNERIKNLGVADVKATKEMFK